MADKVRRQFLFCAAGVICFSLQMMPDSDTLEPLKKTPPLGAAKLALIVGFIPRFSDLSLTP